MGGDIGEKLVEQGKHTVKVLKQTPKSIFYRSVGQKTEEEKKEEEKGELAAVEAMKKQGSQGQQQAQMTGDLKQKQYEAEKKAKYEKMKKILHRQVFDEAEKARKQREEAERLKKMQEEEEKKKKQEEVMVLQEKRKEEAMALQAAKRAKGAGEILKPKK